jgi:glycosyltransferase involved in cell wall biosynthesis
MIRIKDAKSLASEARQPSADSPLSVLILAEPGLDGVFRHVEGLIDMLLKRGARVHLAYSSRRCGAAMLLLVERVRTSGGKVLDLRVSNVPEFGDISAFLRLVGLIRRTRPDIVHAHSSKAGALGRFAALVLRHPYCIYSPQAYYGMAKPRSLKVRFYNWVERLLGRFGTTVAISNDEANFARNVLGVRADRIHVIHNAVDTFHFIPATPEQRRVARDALGIPQEAVVLAIIGRMCWQKDPVTAYTGVAPVCSKNPDLLFVHLGWGKWKQYLLECAGQLGIGKQLRIVDYADDPRGFYNAIDALVVSSRYEAGWPLVFLEAMACNLPVVAATGMGMSDVGNAHLSHVWTFPPEHAAGCTAAVSEWLVAHRQGIHNCNHRQFAIDHLSPERCLGAILDLYLKKPGDGCVLPLRQ